MKKYFVLIGLFLLLLFGGKAHAAEAVCARGDILLCEDFQWSTNAAYIAPGPDWTAHGWDPGNAIDPTNPDSQPPFHGNNVYCNNIGYNGQKCALQLAVSPAVGAGTEYPDKGIVGQRGPVYMRFYLKFANGWIFYPESSASAQKTAYLRANIPGTGGNFGWSMAIDTGSRDTKWDSFAFNTTTCPPSAIPPATTKDRTQGLPTLDNHHANIFHQSHDYNEDTGACLTFTTDPRPLFYYRPNTWYSVEFMVKPSTTSLTTDGATALWIDGRLLISKQNIAIIQDDSTHPIGWVSGVSPVNDIWLTGNYGGPDTYAQALPAVQYMYYSNVVASTSYIGPMGVFNPNAPASPAGIGAR